MCLRSALDMTLLGGSVAVLSESDTYSYSRFKRHPDEALSRYRSLNTVLDRDIWIRKQLNVYHIFIKMIFLKEGIYK